MHHRHRAATWAVFVVLIACHSRQPLEPDGAAPTSYSIGGTVGGLVGTGLVLQNEGGDDLVISGASFVFATKLADGAPYAVTVKTQPPSQSCVVTAGSGTVSGTDASDVAARRPITGFLPGRTYLP